jgi:Heterokaryon incompatibility protein (HET)
MVVGNPYENYFTGRSVGAADDPSQMTRWLQACTTEHEACNQDSYLRGNHPSLEPPVLPKRVLNVGGTPEHPVPFLFEPEGTKAQYLTLSHRWGASKVSMTTKAVLKNYKDELPFDSLCKTFQDAITITRKLGFQYIWIDALCIIQDSEEDWREEASKMADIYRSATISLSASIAISGNSGLIYPRDKPTAVELPLRVLEDYPPKTLTYSVGPRCLPSFHEEVETGTLAKRAWCLQERVLPLRIIHFGQQQLHWECATTSLSESATTKINASGAVREMRNVLAASAAEWHEQRMEIVKNELPAAGRLKQIYGRGHYGKWYQMIMEYTRREITKETDRLPALAGLAQAWVQRMPEIYACGLWNEDLAVGLLWAGSSFYSPYGTPSHLKKPTERISPSWSWLSLDGPIEYPLGKLGIVDIERPWFVGAADQKTLTTIGGPGPAFVRITGRVQPLVRMKSFSPQILEHLAHNHQNYAPDQYPRIAFDEQGKYDFRQLWCLLIAFRGCGSKTCGHNAGCALGFALALCVWPNVETGCYKRVGIAQTFQSDWEGVARGTIVLE